MRLLRRRPRPVPRTAVLVPLPAAGDALERCGLPRAGLGAPAGMPPHITILFPFLAPGDVDDAVLAGLREIAADAPAFDVALRGTGRFPGVLYLMPDRAAPFVELTRAVQARWPDHPPYGGAYGAIIPHLTVCTAEEPAGLEQQVEALLPVHARAEELWLMTERRGGSWEAEERFALGGAA